MDALVNLLREAAQSGLYTNLLLEVYDFRHRLLFRGGAGDFPRDESKPVLSASKWVSASVAMAVVERGALSLDLPISRWFPRAGAITPRQLLAFTSGLDQTHPAFKDHALCLQEAADQILASPRFAPGEAFDYGDCHLTVLGAVVERATGAGWQRIFRETLADPLGWSPEAAYYAKPSARKGDQNPRPAAGLLVSFGDYLKFLRMVAAYGAGEGKRLLREESLREMESDQIGGARIEGSGFRDAGLRAGYGLGAWRELGEAGELTAISSPGLFGYYPWLDRGAGIYGLLGAKEPLPVMQKALPFLKTLREAALSLAR